MTHNLLMPLFDKVDLVEQDPKFVDTARKTLPEDRVPRVRFESGNSRRTSPVVILGGRACFDWSSVLCNGQREYGTDTGHHLGAVPVQTFCSGLQNFTPEPRCYDLIWVQWVSGYITDGTSFDISHKERDIPSTHTGDLTCEVEGNSLWFPCV